MMRFSLFAVFALPFVSAQVVLNEGDSNFAVNCVGDGEFYPNFDYFQDLKFKVTDYEAPIVVVDGGVRGR